jgi:hypothetical protein
MAQVNSILRHATTIQTTRSDVSMPILQLIFTTTAFHSHSTTLRQQRPFHDNSPFQDGRALSLLKHHQFLYDINVPPPRYPFHHYSLIDV